MNIKVYAGYYELYITDKEMPRPYVLLEEFDNVPDAEEYCYEIDDYTLLDSDLMFDSQIPYDSLYEDEDYKVYNLGFAEFVA